MSKAGGHSSPENALHLLTKIARDKWSSLFGHFGSREEKKFYNIYTQSALNIMNFFCYVDYGFKIIKILCLHGTTTILIKALLIITLLITLLIMDFTYNRIYP